LARAGGLCLAAQQSKGAGKTSSDFTSPFIINSRPPNLGDDIWELNIELFN
jgi:hypothetical protein